MDIIKLSLHRKHNLSLATLSNTVKLRVTLEYSCHIIAGTYTNLWFIEGLDCHSGLLLKNSNKCVPPHRDTKLNMVFLRTRTTCITRANRLLSLVITAQTTHKNTVKVRSNRGERTTFALWLL